MDNIKLVRDHLRNDFPSLYVKDIDATLKKNNYSYVATYYQLEQAIASNSLNLKLSHKSIKIKSSINLFPNLETAFNSEHRNLETVFNSVQPKLECNCCCDEKIFEDFGQCTNGHIICKLCITPFLI